MVFPVTRVACAKIDEWMWAVECPGSSVCEYCPYVLSYNVVVVARFQLTPVTHACLGKERLMGTSLWRRLGAIFLVVVVVEPWLGAGRGCRPRAGAGQCPVGQLCAHLLPHLPRRYAFEHRGALWGDGVAVAAVERDPKPEPDLCGPDPGDLQVQLPSAQASTESLLPRLLAVRVSGAQTAASTASAAMRVWSLPVPAVAAVLSAAHALVSQRAEGE